MRQDIRQARNTGIATQILQQLGGGRFMVMTGARNFVAGDGYLRFALPKAKDGINRVKIELNAKDLYDVEFGKFRSLDYTKRGEFFDVSVDQLRAIFTANTGLEVSL